MNAETHQTLPTQNERIMASLAHVTILLPLTGIIASIVIWATQKDKSEYVAFQGLQAIAYHLTMILAGFVGMALYMGSFFATFLTIPFGNSSQSFPVFFFVPFIVMGLIMIGGMFFIVYGMVAAIIVFQGKDFRYIVLGNLLKHYLQTK